MSRADPQPSSLRARVLALAAASGLGALAGPPASPFPTATTTTTAPAQTAPSTPPAVPIDERKLTPTRLTALPPGTITNATAPLRIRFSGTPAPDTPHPT